MLPCDKMAALTKGSKPINPLSLYYAYWSSVSSVLVMFSESEVTKYSAGAMDGQPSLYEPEYMWWGTPYGSGLSVSNFSGLPGDPFCLRIAPSDCAPARKLMR